MKTKVTLIDTRAVRVIRASSSNIRAIARMINEKGALLIEDGFEALNILSLVNLQLQRLVEGTINNCMNPNCHETIGLERFYANPLAMTCSEECAIKAVRHAAQKISESLRIDIPIYEKQVRENKRDNHGTAAHGGDEADRASVQMDDISEKLLIIKRRRLHNLGEIIAVIDDGEFDTACHNGCGEEIPLSILLQSPEEKNCVHCQATKKAARK